MNAGTIKSLLFAVLCGFYAIIAPAATSLFSNYGQIQNVQNYSTNPFWTPNSPYNQRLPQPVYAQGADLNADDCISVVQPLVTVQCMTRNNCTDTTVADIRPEIMVQLSKLPGHNYVSACGGYLDYIFEQYVKQYSNQLPNRPVAFPSATTPNQNINNSGGIQIQNPYKQKIPQWQQEINERRQELQDLQQENGAGSEHLSATAFPTTYADLSFSERMENETKGLMPYKDLVTFKSLNVKSAAEWCSDSAHAASEECQRWNDCTEIAVAKDSNVISARYRNNTHEKCDVIECKEGYDPKKDKTGCKLKKGTPCNAFDGVDHVVRQEIDDNGECKIVKCEENFAPNSDGTACEEKTQPTGSDCMDKVTNRDHVTGAKINANGECEITCDSGYEQKSPTELECVKTCEEKRKDIPHATKGEVKNGQCVVTKCEPLWHPSQDGKKCDDDTVYYTMTIVHGRFSGVDNDTDNMCYSVCGVHSGGDDLNAKVLKPILNKNYCAENRWGFWANSEIDFLEVDDTSSKIKFTKEQADKIIQGLNSIKDEDECDDFWMDIDIYIYKVDNGTKTQYEHIVLDE